MTAIHHARRARDLAASQTLRARAGLPICETVANAARLALADAIGAAWLNVGPTPEGMAWLEREAAALVKRLSPPLRSIIGGLSA